MSKEDIINQLNILKHHIENNPERTSTYYEQIDALRDKVRDFERKFPWTRQTLQLYHSVNDNTLLLVRQQIAKGSENQEFNKALPHFLDDCITLLDLEQKQAEEWRTHQKNVYEPWRKMREQLHAKLPSKVEDLFSRFELESEMPEYSDDIVVADLIIDLLNSL